VLTFASDPSTPRKGSCCFRLKDFQNKNGGEKLRQAKKLIRQIQYTKCLFSDKKSKEDWHVKFQFQAKEVRRVAWRDKGAWKRQKIERAITIGERKNHEPKTVHEDGRGRYDMKISKNFEILTLLVNTKLYTVKVFVNSAFTNLQAKTSNITLFLRNIKKFLFLKITCTINNSICL